MPLDDQMITLNICILSDSTDDSQRLTASFQISKTSLSELGSPNGVIRLLAKLYKGRPEESLFKNSVIKLTRRSKRQGGNVPLESRDDFIGLKRSLKVKNHVQLFVSLESSSDFRQDFKKTSKICDADLQQIVRLMQITNQKLDKLASDIESLKLCNEIEKCTTQEARNVEVLYDRDDQTVGAPGIRSRQLKDDCIHFIEALNESSKIRRDLGCKECSMKSSDSLNSSIFISESSSYLECSSRSTLLLVLPRISICQLQSRCLLVKIYNARQELIHSSLEDISLKSSIIVCHVGTQIDLTAVHQPIQVNASCDSVQVYSSSLTLKAHENEESKTSLTELSQNTLPCFSTIRWDEDVNDVLRNHNMKQQYRPDKNPANEFDSRMKDDDDLMEYDVLSSSDCASKQSMESFEAV